MEITSVSIFDDEKKEYTTFMNARGGICTCKTFGYDGKDKTGGLPATTAQSWMEKLEQAMYLQADGYKVVFRSNGIVVDKNGNPTGEDFGELGDKYTGNKH